MVVFEKDWTSVAMASCHEGEGSGVAEWLRFGLHEPGHYDCRQGQESLLFSKASGLILGLTQLRIQWVPGAASLGVKRPGHKANYSSSSNAEVKYGQAILPPTYVPSFRELGQLYILIIPTGWWEAESISNSPSSGGNFFATWVRRIV